MFKFSAALNQNLRIWSVSLTTILRSTLAHIKNLALLHRKQNNHIYDHIYDYIYNVVSSHRQLLFAYIYSFIESCQQNLNYGSIDEFVFGWVG